MIDTLLGERYKLKSMTCWSKFATIFEYIQGLSQQKYITIAFLPLNLGAGTTLDAMNNFRLERGIVKLAD